MNGSGDIRDDDDEAGMNGRLGRDFPDIAGIVGDQDAIAVAGGAGDVPILPTRFAEMGDVASLTAGLAGNGDEIDA